MTRIAQTAHVIVTGGSSGIGAAVVDLLRERGNLVTVFDLQPSDREGVMTEIVDVRDESAVDAAARRAFDRAPVSGVVASHGIRGTFVPALEMELDALRRQFDIHVVGPSR
ncbi:SDR family NAD(P)-dependent oxidoreductase [Microbacterium sp. NIBRBAC000506063]|uniref:SDR family NAD(P)-dependent oxidoreductase n=1 Tax=Microbacterium sp. NIBRBAC000506063 TaxID=2734618 RepID=UPI001BB6B498|nr:SDR family NAD(P)-dependent oxidoreductase [Microbacterium sp. NIBRBAC000506063]QTV79073.1 SDR family NAD(P)-dependent oxidoreductase [Microbacterium sp. NIBRBAC000506063]